MGTDRRPLRPLFPKISPYDRGRLRVSELHTLSYEQCGNPRGKPIVFLHGGPGGHIGPQHRRFFHPRKWRAVLFDQRGCGRSTPHAELRENTTWELVADIERLREHLGIDRWTVFGGSWGSTLALAYGQAHPGRCAGLILRGIFLGRRREVDWLFQEGAGRIFPDAWEGFLAPIPPRERGDLTRAYHRRLTSQDGRVRLAAARAWAVWEAACCRLLPDPGLLRRTRVPRTAVAIARLECHYMLNRLFLRSDRQLLDGVRRIRAIPGVIIHGRYDMVCPIESAWELHRAWPEARLVVVPDAGHVVAEPGIESALVEATERFAR